MGQITYNFFFKLPMHNLMDELSGTSMQLTCTCIDPSVLKEKAKRIEFKRITHDLRKVNELSVDKVIID